MSEEEDQSEVSDTQQSLQEQIAAETQATEESKSSIPRNVKLVSTTIPLQYRTAQMTLPPYSPISKDAMLDKPVLLTSEAPTVTQMPQTYQGRQAQDIIFEINQPVSIQGNQSYAYPIIEQEDGQLVHFTVSVDSDQIVVSMVLYDADGRAATICNDTARQLAGKGRGMTLSQALAKDMNGISLDMPGTPHFVMPFVSRYKDTFSLGFNDPTDYATVAGTENDKFYIIEYSPSIPRAYQRIEFNITNNGSPTRAIHYAMVNRYRFIDKYDYGPIPVTPDQVTAAGGNSGSYSSVAGGGGNGNSTANFARRAKIRL